MAIQPGLLISNGIITRRGGFAADFPMNIDIFALSTEVLIADIDDPDDSIGCTVSATDGEGACPLFDHTELYDSAAGLFAWNQFQVDIFKVAQII